jgi:hypothetical protein
MMNCIHPASLLSCCVLDVLSSVVGLSSVVILRTGDVGTDSKVAQT